MVNTACLTRRRNNKKCNFIFHLSLYFSLLFWLLYYHLNTSLFNKLCQRVSRCKRPQYLAPFPRLYYGLTAYKYLTIVQTGECEKKWLFIQINFHITFNEFMIIIHCKFISQNRNLNFKSAVVERRASSLYLKKALEVWFNVKEFQTPPIIPLFTVGNRGVSCWRPDLIF